MTARLRLETPGRRQLLRERALRLLAQGEDAGVIAERLGVERYLVNRWAKQARQEREASS